MGEYAIRKADNERIKIGVCEELSLLRYEDIDKISKASGSLDPSEPGLLFRLPFPDEDDIRPGDYQGSRSGPALGGLSYPELSKSPGVFQTNDGHGLLLTINCYHGEKLPTGSSDVRVSWNGKGSHYRLAYIKTTKTGALPVIQCAVCGKLWSSDDWDDVKGRLHFNEAEKELKKRLAKYF